MRVLTKAEHAERAGISLRTYDRESAKGRGAALVHLSPRRRGITELDSDAWILERRRPAPGKKSADPDTEAAADNVKALNGIKQLEDEDEGQSDAPSEKAPRGRRRKAPLSGADASGSYKTITQ